MTAQALSTNRSRLIGVLLISSLLLGIAGILIVGLSTPQDVRFDLATSNPDRVAASQTLAPFRGVLAVSYTLAFLAFAVIASGLVLVTPALRQPSARPFATVGLVLIVTATVAWALATYQRLALTLVDIRQTSDIPPLVGIVGLDITAQRLTIILLTASVAFYGFSLFRSGILHRVGIVTAVLNGVVAIAALVLFLQSGGLPPIVPILCAVAIGIGLILRR